MNEKVTNDTYIYLFAGIIMVLLSFSIIYIQTINCDVSQFNVPECLAQYEFKYLPNVIDLHDYYFSKSESFMFMFLMCMGWYLLMQGLVPIMVSLGIIEQDEKIHNFVKKVKTCLKKQPRKQNKHK